MVKCLGAGIRTPLAKRVEIDFSTAMIAATVQVFFNGRTTVDYLNSCWKELAGLEAPLRMNVHICHYHSSNVFKRKFDLYYGTDSTESSVLMPLAKKIINSERMEELEFYVTKLLLVCGSSHVTAEVAAALINLDELAPAEGAIPAFDYGRCNIPEDPKDSDALYVTTYFGAYFRELADTIEAKGQQGDSLNDMYCKPLVKYFCVYIFPYLSILTNVMFVLREDLQLNLHNQPVEKWHDIVKNHEQGVDGKQKVPQYIRSSATVIKGNEMIAAHGHG